jgi:hypothetical protein
MTRTSVVLGSLALAMAVGACGSSSNNNQPAPAGGGAVNAQLPAQSRPTSTTATPSQAAAAGKPAAKQTHSPAPHYGVTYKGPKPKPLPPMTEPLRGTPADQALQGSVERFVAWGSSFYGTTVAGPASGNTCKQRQANVWACSVTIEVTQPKSGYAAGPMTGGYTVTLDPSAKTLTYASGLS